MKKSARSLLILIVVAIFITCFAIPFQVGATSSIRVLYKCSISNDTTTRIAPWFIVYNDGPVALPLSQVKIRYWYTRDSFQSQMSACDYAQVGAANVTQNIVALGALATNSDYYFEVGFTSGAGTLAPGANSGEIQLRLWNELYLDYTQANDYSFNASLSTFSQNTHITVYTNGNLVYGTEPPSAAGKGFLVIVGKPLYNTGLITTALKTYMSDLTAEGWQPKLMRIDVNSNSTPDILCANAAVLKSEIQTFYNQGYAGLVLIGSEPAVPSALWRNSPDSEETISPTDLIYADMDPWTDYNNDGVYDTCDDSNNYYGGDFEPELILGRISAGGISASISEEAVKIAHYFDKVHAYRTYGSNLTPAQQNRMLLFYDHPDFKGNRGEMVDLLDLTTEIHGIFDDQTTTKEKLKAELEYGYKFAQLRIHSDQNAHYLNLAGAGEAFDINYLNTASPKVHYLNLFCCSACRYREYNKVTTAWVNERNLGETYLFNNDYVLNITGSTGDWGFIPDAAYWSDIRQEKPIGEALRAFFERMIDQDKPENGCPKGILLGDPTLTYSFPNITNKASYIIDSHLEGLDDLFQAHAVPGQAFEIWATDPENDPADIDVMGLPPQADVEDQVPNYFSWTPTADDSGNVYHLTATVSDAIGHQYVEQFSVKVLNYPEVEVNNWGFDGVYNDNGVMKPMNWETVNSEGSPELTADKSEHLSWDWSACINNSIASAGCFRISVNVNPNTDYVLKGWLKTLDVAEGTGAQIRITGLPDFYATESLFESHDWTPKAVSFNSGSCSTIQIECCLGTLESNSTGTVWFENIKLDVLGNNPITNCDFEDGATLTDYWNKGTSGTTTISQDSAIKYSGTYSLKIHAQYADDARMVQVVDLKPHTTYRLKGRIRTENVSIGGNKGARLAVEFPYVNSPVFSDIVPDGTKEWQEVTCEFNSYEHSWAFIQCRLGWYEAETSGTAWFDDLTLTEIPENRLN